MKTARLHVITYLQTCLKVYKYFLNIILTVNVFFFNLFVNKLKVSLMFLKRLKTFLFEVFNKAFKNLKVFLKHLYKILKY